MASLLFLSFTISRARFRPFQLKPNPYPNPLCRIILAVNTKYIIGMNNFKQIANPETKFKVIIQIVCVKVRAKQVFRKAHFLN